ncbi:MULTISPECIES: phage head closure protein [Staphylococcus]|uniref:phage head closure protein n=1 Tax=Staphylococcus TaxID=1279 RepID=UPI00076B48CC|nr:MULTISPECIES: phage head closure protein [Staphylococcus]DAH60870.1 MAG TPA: head closure knob [Caudoviricetes sp.]AMG64674.1 phage head-tail adapter protein [Staphylococcus lugdunensis]MCH8657738.1 phage head closure protein [Staphylococcus lugdunensis]MCH8668198.1 phage head closure protein [Staphylococcus lugdunensis]MCH8673933.1 phage head closure protein [Staphylococcus lugdunensis]
MFNPFDEFPHAISIGHIEKVVDYPIAKERYVSERIINGFMDTPTTSEQLKYHQMSQEFDRNLYVPYSQPITTNNYFKYEGRVFGIVGEPIDQGGQHEINLIRLKELPYGQS